MNIRDLPGATIFCEEKTARVRLAAGESEEVEVPEYAISVRLRKHVDDVTFETPSQGPPRSVFALTEEAGPAYGEFARVVNRGDEPVDLTLLFAVRYGMPRIGRHALRRLRIVARRGA